MMMGYGGGFGWNISMYLSMLFSMLLPMLLIAGVVLLIIKLRDSKKANADPDPMTILKKRYAKGEITREEFNQIRAELKDE